MTITEKLCDFLGEPLVAYITQADHRAVEDWHDGRAVPTIDQLETIVYTWSILQHIETFTCDNTAKAWFTKDNESLFGRSPAEAIREGNLRDAQLAAHLFIDSNK